MNIHLLYALIFVLLFLAELLYFRVADKFNIIDKPNERSSHSSIVLRGGGIVFLLGVWIWSAFYGFQYPLFLIAVTLAAGISFIDDIRSLPDSIRLIVQFAAMGLLIWQLFSASGDSALFGDGNIWLKVLFIAAALVVCVGATNIYNFMDGVNGITAGYSFAVLLPLILINLKSGFVEQSLLIVTTISVLVFSIFNFRPKGKAKCFAGDVGSVGIAFILLFAIGMLIVKTGDITWLILLIVYGVDGCMTICHRIMLHEKLGEAHRKHAYQLMANELRMSHPMVSCIYMAIQLAVSLGFIYLIPEAPSAHWIYVAGTIIVLALAYILFMKKYYHLHEEYLTSLKSK
ncbi:MAG TPA: glycosyltransferase family 4 protein [Candidatus Coprenecus pullistercoris]|nr:glycosyltransferase family 4 protein [Candidatus Coprenecus pullistercoris]